MSKEYRVEATWTARREGTDALAQRLWSFFEALGSVHGSLAGWSWENPSNEEVRAVDGKRAVRNAIESSAKVWYAGDGPRTCFLPRFALIRAGITLAEMSAVFGIDLPDIGIVYAPESIRLLLHAAADRAVLSPAGMEGLLRSAVGAFAPDTAHAGSRIFPRPPQPLDSSGIPAVGWMTYFSARYKPPVEPVARPAVTHVVDGGFLIIAKPTLFRDGVAEDLAAIENVRLRLVENGSIPTRE